MKLEKILKEAAEILGIDAPAKSPNRRILFRCANLALWNVSVNYKNIRENIPQFKTTSDKVENFDISTAALLYGTMSEYASVSGLVAEEKIFAEKFERLVYGLRHVGKIRRMP